MSDIKRRPSEEDTNGHVVKKRALETLSEEGPLTQDDVIYFQKELIWRQMKHYKKQYQLINSQLEFYRKQALKDQKNISLLIQWYKQVVLNFATSDDSEVDENLLVELAEVKDDKDLSQIRDAFLKVLSNIKGESKDTERINRINELSKNVVELTSSNEVLQRNEQLLKDQVAVLQEQVLELNKTMERANSKSLQRINGDVKKEEDVPLEVPDVNQIKEELVNNEEFEKLKIQLNELKDVNENLTKQVQEEMALTSNLKKEMMNYSLRLSNLKEEDLINSTQYQSLKNENASLSEEAADLRLKVKQYFTKITELENERVQFQSNLTSEIAKEKAELTKTLEKMEQDLVRIRTGRDDLMSKNSVLKSDKTYKETLDELSKLVELQRKRIDDLTRSRQENLNSDNNNSELHKENLLKQNSLLVGELKDLEIAFKEAHDLSIKKLASAAESSSLLNKLNVEKTKADQKYFSTMRVNDSLIQENKISKLTISKQQELIASLREMEKKCLSKIEVMELKFKDLKFLENNLVNENQQFKKKLLESANKIESLSKHNASLIEISQKLNSEKDLETNLRKQKENEIVRISSKLKSVDALNAKYRSNLAGTVLQEDEEQINALRAMVKCSLCSKNWKDTVIKDCGHVFCSDCAQERLAARLRRCPTCNKQFSSNDLISIHL